MKKFTETHKEIPFKYYEGVKFKDETKYDILIFEYRFGLNQLFVRNDHDKIFYECNGGTNFSSSGGKSSGMGRNIFYESFRREFQYYIVGDSGLLSFGTSSHFNMLKEFDLDISNIEYKELPTRRYLEQSYKTKDGCIILVSNLEFHFYYENYRLHIGDTIKGFIEYKPHVERYRDGGTTYYKTEIGTLYTPTAWEKELKPTWEDIEVSEYTDIEKLKISLEELGIFEKKLEE